jgi:hypothetical protein
VKSRLKAAVQVKVQVEVKAVLGWGGRRRAAVLVLGAARQGSPRNQPPRT